ncbi:MAG: family 16 glycoside hydrolase [Phycisphaerae bacterium]
MPTKTILILLGVATITISSAHAREREPGLLVRFYDIDGPMHALPALVPNQLPNVVKAIPTLELRTDRGDFGPFEGNFYTEVEGFIRIAQPGTYAFRLVSDDGSTLWIDGKLVVDHDGLHAAVPKDGTVELTAGEHALRVLHFESGGGEHLELRWRPPGAPKGKFELIPAELLTHAADASRETAPGQKRIIPPLRRGRPGDGTPVAGVHPSFGHVLTGSAMYGVQEDAAIEELEIGVRPPRELTSSLILVPPDDRPIGRISRARLWSPRHPDAHWAPPPYARQSGLDLLQLVVAAPQRQELYRVVTDEVAEIVQGSAFRFSGGFPGTVESVAGALPKEIVVWLSVPKTEAYPYGEALCYLRPNQRVTFEMLAVRAMTNGFEIEFTKPLDPRCGWEPESYYVEQWSFRLASDEATERRSDEGRGGTGSLLPVREDTGGQAARGTRRQSDEGRGATGSLLPVREGTGGQAARGTRRDTAQGAVAHREVHPPTRDGVRYPVKSASVSPDRKKVFLEIEDLKLSHVVYIRLLPPCISADGELPWSTEAWYTLNVIPPDRYGKVLTPPPPEPQNFLTEEEKAVGWRLLFDGKTTNGWHGYKKDSFPSDGWKVIDTPQQGACLVRVGPAGDIATDEEFDNFELKLEWRISAAGNSGIFYRVKEKYGWPWESGPELQVLDNAEHADGRNPKTSAGSNYALHAPLRDVTQPVGLFNQVRILADGPHVEHWLNGVKVVEYELWTDEWKRLVAGSKFKKWPNYGLVRKGHIVLQDHGDKVWYRNIKIRRLKGE